MKRTQPQTDRSRDPIFPLCPRDTFITIIILATAAALCLLLRMLDDGDIYVSMLFQLAVIVVSRLTSGFFYGIAASVIGVIGVNYAFTAPYFKLSLSVPGYPLAFASMLAVAVTTSAMTSQIKRQEKQRYRIQVESMRANLLRAVSHDLRTPLTSISGAASVLASQPEMPRASQERLLSEIIDDSQWLIRMVENLLSITRINPESARLSKSPEAAEEVISESVRKFRKRFSDPVVEIKLPDELLIVPMDAILIEQVLTNLLENVVYHAKSATQICLTLQRCGNDAVFEIADNGVGIQPNKIETLFVAAGSATERPDSSKSMGIGLSVCNAIIQAHGGKITAGNRPEGGAVFRFTLPAKEDLNESSNNYSDC